MLRGQWDNTVTTGESDFFGVDLDLAPKDFTMRFFLDLMDYGGRRRVGVDL